MNNNDAGYNDFLKQYKAPEDKEKFMADISRVESFTNQTVPGIGQDAFWGPIKSPLSGIALEINGPGFGSVSITQALDAPKAKTYDDGKLPLSWLPWAAINDLSAVQQYGHKKYKDFNNYRKGMEVSRNLSCALRHIADYLEGRDQDAESGLNPLSHAMCRVAFVLQNIHDGTAIDDRYKK